MNNKKSLLLEMVIGIFDNRNKINKSIMSDKYTTETASIKATIGKFRKLDTDKLTIKGQDISELIGTGGGDGGNGFDSYDTRDPQLKNDELDIWNTAISLSDNGHIEVKPLEHSSISSTQKTTLKSAVKVIDNEVLGTNDGHLMYWQTDGLTSGTTMFRRFSNLTSFNSDLSNLTNGSSMFYNCSNLITFTSDLSSLTNGVYMFQDCSKLITFTSDLSNLTVAQAMFNGTKLTSFSSDLSSLTNGGMMFYGCSNLTSFNGNLSSLTSGEYMFYGCKLDTASVANIVHTIKDTNNNENFLEPMTEITIGIGCDATEEDQLLFAQECDCETWGELLDDFALKNWGVEFQCNGRPTTTYNMRRGETLPIYAKLEEATDENLAQYTSADGSKFYNIRYFHSTNGSTEGYDVFSSLEEAISTYNVTPKN